MNQEQKKPYLSVSHITTILLITLAVIFGYFFYYKALRAPSPSVLAPTSSPQPITRLLAPEERELLDFKDHNPTEETGQLKTRHDELIAQLAKEADFLDITGCVSEPLVFRVRMQKSFTVRNSDGIPHILRHGPRQEIKVPPKGETTVTAREFFIRAPANYMYTCDDLSTTVGLFVVDP